MKRKIVEKNDKMVADDDECLFVCQDKYVMEKFRLWYIDSETYPEPQPNPEEQPNNGKPTSKLLDRLRRAIFPCMTFENRLLDITLGLLLFYYFWFSLDISVLSTLVLHGAMQLADLLDSTITWLGAVPAGLKLNEELVGFLGLFFRYHIHLFKGYLEMISPYMPWFLQAITLTCIPGLTCFLSYSLSFSVVLLLHIHCFYAYACHLYRTQLVALVSLGRLFAGIKYNPLRARLDSVAPRGDHLILSTLLSSTLLFLFPSTLLYYLVFTLVNTALLVVQMCVVTCVSVIRTLPLRDLVKVVLCDRDVICDVMIEPVGRGEREEGAVFVVSAVYKSVGQCMAGVSLGNHSLGVETIWRKCLKGDIIKVSF